MSQIHYREFTLKDMVASATAIFVVTADHPFTKEEEIDIRTPVQMMMPGSKKKYPAYRRSCYCVEIMETLMGPQQKGSLQIRAADDERRFNLHKRYYHQCLRKSPIYGRYAEGLADLA